MKENLENLINALNRAWARPEIAECELVVTELIDAWKYAELLVEQAGYELQCDFEKESIGQYTLNKM